VSRWLKGGLLPLLLLLTACSTQKNTWLSRHYQELNTRYNVHFNGHEAYKQGLDQLANGLRDDYTQLLPMYPVSNHSQAKGTSGSMKKAIEKCEKAIKQRSIRVKPKKKPESTSKESYKRFYAKEEFNPFMDEVFLLMANAQFHMADFNSSAATCSYIMRHFADDKAVQDKATILLARSYKELEWFYDAENSLRELNTPLLTPSLNGAFAAAYADFLLTRKQYHETIPYLTVAIRQASNRKEKQRWTFLLGQLYQVTGQREKAYKVFSDIPGMNPPYDMDISARILQTEVYPGNNPIKPLKKLKRLSRSRKNKDYLDQIYYAMGNLYLTANDTTKALEQFHLSLNKATKQGPNKLKTLLVLGNLYYSMEAFRDAAPLYAEALPLLKKTDERYPEASFRAMVLKELEPPLTLIHETDSLVNLSTWSEEALNHHIDSLVKDAQKKAREERRKQNTQEALGKNQALSEDNRNDDKEPSHSTLDPTDKSWYFYNSTMVTKGLSDFQRKWGKRSLGDDWRRARKTNPFESMADPTGQLADQEQPTSEMDSLQANVAEVPVDSLSTDSLAEDGNNKDYSVGADDPLHPNHYLSRIPFTTEQKEKSHLEVAEALFKAGRIYRELMENDRLALQTFDTLEARYPESEHLEQAWYISYLAHKQARRDDAANQVRRKLLDQFPESQSASKLADSLYIEHLIEMYLVQDTLYETTYLRFANQEADSLFASSQWAKTRYPFNTHMPRYLFLEALQHGRMGAAEAFHDTLTTLVAKYPKSDLIPVVNAMLALWDSGKRPVPSSGYVSLFGLENLLTEGDQNSQDSLLLKLTYTPEEPHTLVMAYPTDSVNGNRLQFDVALYNFTTFLIKDYELSLAKVGQMNVLLVQGFENAADVLRYRAWINFQNQAPTDKYPGLRLIPISNNNLPLLEQGLDPSLYWSFFLDHYTPSEPLIP
jgi:tetratricopeptide (TPR) repeat protein